MPSSWIMAESRLLSYYNVILLLTYLYNTISYKIYMIYIYVLLILIAFKKEIYVYGNQINSYSKKNHGLIKAVINRMSMSLLFYIFFSYLSISMFRRVMRSNKIIYCILIFQIFIWYLLRFHNHYYYLKFYLWKWALLCSNLNWCLVKHNLRTVVYSLVPVWICKVVFIFIGYQSVGINKVYIGKTIKAY